MSELDPARRPSRPGAEAFARAILALRRLEAGDAPLEPIEHTTIALVDATACAADEVFHAIHAARANAHAITSGELHAASAAFYAILAGACLGLDRSSLLDVGGASLIAERCWGSASPRADDAFDWSPERRGATRRLRAAAALASVDLGDEAAMARALIVAEMAGERSADLHPLSQLARVAWAYAALTAPRLWRGAYSPEGALELLRAERGVRFDPVALAGMECALAAYLGVQLGG